MRSKQNFERASLKAIFESVCRLLKVSQLCAAFGLRQGQASRRPPQTPTLRPAFTPPTQVAYEGQALQHPDTKPLINALLQLAEQILLWQFSSRTSHR